MLFPACSKQFLSERYRSGHNGADSKSDGGLIAPQGFESLPLRQISRLRALACFLQVSNFRLQRVYERDAASNARLSISRAMGLIMNLTGSGR